MKKELARQILRNLRENTKSGSAKDSAQNIKDMAGKLKDLQKHIEWLKGVHEHYSQQHEEAIRRHEAGDHNWVVRNHHHDGPIGRW
jgi:hypothetical protein